eukprot:TRINITY_DN5291_c0_g1_i4.p1 TRINITY_DN5291_c0_g1~~TRINITY_DN5291_c0_g1_i4.p1  ORF type:complete len:129 (+),score=14.19 TRINITY_DN5291_c0_g1_i4:219-605(+)
MFYYCQFCLFSKMSVEPVGLIQWEDPFIVRPYQRHLQIQNWKWLAFSEPHHALEKLFSLFSVPVQKLHTHKGTIWSRKNPKKWSREKSLKLQLANSALPERRVPAKRSQLWLFLMNEIHGLDKNLHIK